MSEDLKNEIESRLGFLVGEPTETAFAVTGEPYVPLCSGGINQGGGPVPAWYATPDLASDAWLEAVERYAAKVTGGEHTCAPVMYWRSPPDIDQRTVYEIVPPGHSQEPGTTLERVTLYNVYSRLLISDKPREVDQVA